ncbi:efflux RND transporter periplasmic adaptor subunit [Tianweitania sp. BSSL-BM11]|uniref:Efflux RND transporter periplasmic adaptor subunit n=1 Tax=Tianweitania aestuarii TaxID=2814886 RepID=A0ABS5RZH5_9HYPH|nr:efflux RND transporter periplasmic adaptor subunit [Tianweitania aestuarii]MBS9722451.1 efflux RND transporter periplasmic adaptor subunit [Tianweitania aestuarii]
MAVWKQLILGLIVLVIGAALWVRFVPGSAETLAKLGLDVPAWAAVEPQQQAAGGGGRGGNQRSDRAATVVAPPATRATINDRLSAIGTGNAIRSVNVMPFVSGRLVEIPVTSGNQVAEGDVIARLDADAERIAVDRAKIALENTQAALDRSNALRNSNTITAVAQTDAKLAVDNARLELEQAELNLERRSITAPIGGVVGIVPVEVGDYVTSQTEIVTLDDRSEILVDFWVPERFAGSVKVGAPVKASLVARPDQNFEGVVSALDSRLDPASRTMRVQAKLPNPDDRLRAGMSFEVSMTFPGDTFPAVNPLAIQWSTEGAFVWQIRDNKAERTPVRIIQRNTDAVLVEADIPEGRPVITEGLQALRNGAAVQIAGGNQPQPVATTETPGNGS